MFETIKDEIHHSFILSDFFKKWRILKQPPLKNKTRGLQNEENALTHRGVDPIK